LIAAAAGGHLECVRLLVDYGADVQKSDPVRVDDRMPLESAFYRRQHTYISLTTIGRFDATSRGCKWWLS
jgi:hypothetical protein